MLYLARFRNNLAPILVDAHSSDDATALATATADEAPVELREVPPGLLLCDVRFADPDDGSDPDEENPANFAIGEIALEPVEGFAAWLADVDEADLPEDPAHAETEPPPEEEKAEDVAADVASQRYNPPPRLSDAD